jgi:molybdopterin-guanine dinucleotide biosynthesis protein A
VRCELTILTVFSEQSLFSELGTSPEVRMAGSVSVAILAGGQSSRMGTNKALVRVGGKPIVERIVERVRPLSDDLILVTNRPEAYAWIGLPTFGDLVPNKGPLGGLYSALSAAQGPHTLVVSCDQPFLNVDLLRYLIELREGFDVVVPLAPDGYPQSMHAVYGKACLDPIRAKLDADRLKVIGFFGEVTVREVPAEEIAAIDPDRLSFVNINTPEDLAEAERLAERIG